MSRSSSAVSTAVVGAVMTGVLFALAGCAGAEAPSPSPSPSPTEATTPPPEPYDGPLVFVGDELGTLMLDSGEIEALLPGAADVSTPSAELHQISDGGGYIMPAICSALVVEQSLGSVGARTETWSIDGQDEGIKGSLYVLQFADEAHAQARMDQVLAANEQCAAFDYDGPSAFSGVVQEPGDDVRVLAGTFTSDSPEPNGWRAVKGFATVGNVLIALSHPYPAEQEFDLDAIATALADSAADGRSALIEKLTATPPEEAEAGPEAPALWSEWAITPQGVGPIALGMTVDEAVAAASGSELRDAEYEGGPRRLASSDGSASVLLNTNEAGLITSITVGALRWQGEGFNGDALPSIEGVRVGASGADALALYPENTQIWVVSSAESLVVFSDRDGRQVRFSLDGEEGGAADAAILGITIEDATQSDSLSFG